MEIDNGAGAPAAMDSAVSESSAQVESAAPVTSSEAGTGTARDALERAFAAVDAPETGDDKAATDKPSDTRKRDATGKFATPDKAVEKPAAEAAQTQDQQAKPAEANPLDEPPSRFTADAKAAWKDAPPALKGEVKRAFTEMETGLKQYQDAFTPLKPFFEIAQKSGTTLDQALARFTNMEQMLRRDPLAGLDQVCQHLGTNLRAVAAHVLGQPQEASQARSDQTIAQLRQQVAHLQQQVGGVSQTIQQQKMAQTYQQIEAFSADKPRFEELAPVMADMIQKGFASDLQDAYVKADRLNPAPAPALAPPAAPAAQAAPPAAPAASSQALAAQTRKGQLSTTGAPSSGSNPINRKPPSSPRDALARSFSALGI